jgi:hypothetical protein
MVQGGVLASPVGVSVELDPDAHEVRVDRLCTRESHSSRFVLGSEFSPGFETTGSAAANILASLDLTSFGLISARSRICRLPPVRLFPGSASSGFRRDCEPDPLNSV